MSDELPRVERSDSGHPVWIHSCSAAGPEFDPVVPATLPLGSTGWEWTDDGGLVPSILCMNCQVHGFWVGGEQPFWRSC